MLKRKWRTNWIILAATLVHLVWGVVLLFSDAPLHTTPLGMLHRVPILGQQYVAAFVYIGASVAAGVPVVWPRLDTTFRGLLLSLPQQFLLMVSFFTAAVAIAHGTYPDGYVPDVYGSPALFILCDQLWPMIGVVVHTLSLIDWYWWSRLTLKDM